MADVRNWEAFIRGRWPWTRYGYEKGFPRGCQFTDVDALVEFDGNRLMIEAKQWDGIGARPPQLPTGQQLALGVESADEGKTVFVLYGCASCDDPMWVTVKKRQTDPDRPRYLLPDEQYDLRDMGGRTERRRALKLLIDQAMGVSRNR